MSMKASLFIALSFLFLASVHSSGVLKLHGGAVMNFPISLHYFYYGPFAQTDEEVQLTVHFGSNIAASGWWKVTTCIEDPQGNPVTSHIDVPNTFIDKNTNKGKTVSSQADALTLLRKMISDNNVGEDPNDIYVLWLHDDVAANWLCNDANGACAYHSFYNASRGNIKYVVVGGGGTIGMQCAPCQGPNGPWTPLTNQMVNSFANALVRTVSDPVPFTGWYDADTLENGQKCAGQYINSQTFRPNKNVQWNIALGQNNIHWYLIQGNWDITTDKCVMFPTQDCSKIAPSKPITSAPHSPGSAAGLNANIISVVTLCSALFAFIFLF